MNAKEIIFGLAIALILSVLISPYASPWLDGLEKVAENKGFLEKGEVEPVVSSPIPDYAWPGIENEGRATSAAGAAGTILMFAMGYGVAVLIKRKAASA